MMLKNIQAKIRGIQGVVRAADRHLERLHRLTDGWADDDLAQLRQEVQACREHADAVTEENDHLKMQVAGLKEELGTEQTLRAQAESKYRMALGDFKDLDTLLEAVQLSAQRARLLDEANAKIAQLTKDHMVELGRAGDLQAELEEARAKIAKLEAWLEEELDKQTRPAGPRSTQRQRTLDLLSLRPHKSPEVAQALGITTGAASRLLSRLKANGHAKRSADGFWSLSAQEIASTDLKEAILTALGEATGAMTSSAIAGALGTTVKKISADMNALILSGEVEAVGGRYTLAGEEDRPVLDVWNRPQEVLLGKVLSLKDGFEVLEPEALQGRFFSTMASAKATLEAHAKGAEA